MRRKKTVICIGAVILLVLILGAVWLIAHRTAYRVAPLTTEQLQKNGADTAEKLMIVAHPDDDVIWGGGHLSEGGYFVVCVTNGRNKTRKAEFEQMLTASNNHGIILEYPDKVLWLRDDWKQVREQISADLSLILGYHDWDLIVTHNADGEYGHQHHIMTHEIVTDIYKAQSNGNASPLYYFGKYYPKDKIESAAASLTPISPQQLSEKERLEKIYVSQKNTVAMFSHMNSFEMWEKYESA